jgi:hypothetical protein
MRAFRLLPALAVVLLAGAPVLSDEGKDDKGWITLFNGKDTSGWKLRDDKLTITKFVDADGKEVADAKKGKVDQKAVVQDAKGKPIEGAKIVDKDGKKVAVDADGKAIEGAKIVLTGGRDAIVNKKGEELKDVKAVTETVANASGWTVEDGVLISSKPHHGNDLLTERKFTDFELHVEFKATDNSGVYLQGRYEIQIINSFGVKPKVIEKDGKQIETLDSHQCGAIYGRIAPSKNMAKKPDEWQSYDVVFRGARGEKGKVTEKARVTLIWNGEKVIDNGEIEGPTGAALDDKVTEPGPILLQGDHGKVSFRNIKIKPLTK